jgi:broad specificity phosphatase PhoE
MPTRLILVCHAATAATRAAAFPSDDALSAGAAERAAALAPRLGRADRAWTSPALCTRQTAAALGLAADPHPALRDCAYGRWSGRKLAEVMAEDPNGVAVWLADAAAAPHGGEPLAALFDRVAGWLSERVAEDGHTVAVTHAAVMRAAVLHVLDASVHAFWRIDIEPLSMIDLRSDGTRWTVRVSREGRSAEAAASG